MAARPIGTGRREVVRPMALWWGIAAAPFVLALVVVCLREPLRIALPLFAASVPLGGALDLGSSPFGSVSSLAGLVLAAGLAWQLARRRVLVRDISPGVAVWLIFAALAAATTLWSVNRTETVKGVAVLASLVLLYALVTVSPVNADVLRRTETGALAGGVLVVLYGLYQLTVLGGFPDPASGETSLQGGRFGEDLLGANLEAVALLLPLVIAVRRAAQQSRSFAPRCLYAAASLLVLGGILMTGSRTGTVAAVLAVLALAVAAPARDRASVRAALAAGVLLCAIVWVFHPGGIAEREFASVTSSSGRADIWDVGRAACHDYCLQGAGWGGFPEVYAATQASVPGARVLVGDEGSYQAHNLVLLVVVELGLAGVALLLAGLVLAAVRAVRLPPSYRAVPVAAVCGLGTAVVFLSSMEFKFFWLVLIIVELSANVAAAEARSDRQDQLEPTTGRS